MLICSPRTTSTESCDTRVVHAAGNDTDQDTGDTCDADVKKALRMMRKKERNRLKRGANCSRLRHEAEFQAERLADRDRDEYKSRPVPMMMTSGASCRDDSGSGDLRAPLSSPCTADDEFARESGDGEEGANLDENEDWGKLPDVEKKHVLDVYETIADHFSGTRYKTWPRVREFVEKLPENRYVHFRARHTHCDVVVNCFMSVTYWSITMIEVATVDG